jgi:hypothetical protein
MNLIGYSVLVNKSLCQLELNYLLRKCKYFNILNTSEFLRENFIIILCRVCYNYYLIIINSNYGEISDTV